MSYRLSIQIKMIGLKEIKDYLKYYYYRPLRDAPGMGKFEVSPTFDPQLGYGAERKERVMVATEQEMDAARLDIRDRDYCSHALIKLVECKTLHNLRTDWYCHHQKHAYAECEFEDHVIRMKEYEREKRLQARAAKKAAKAKKLAQEEID